MKVIVKKLIWDNWNRQHIKKHRVTIAEIEESLADPYVTFIGGHSNRLMSLGRSGERLISTILKAQDKTGDYYVVTSRDMAKKERPIYRINKQRLEKLNEKNT